MSEQSDMKRRAQAPAMVQLWRRVLLVVGLSAIILVSLWLWISWQVTKQAQLQRMRQGVVLIVGHSENFFNSIASHLDGLADDLIKGEALNSADVARALLEKFKAKHPDLVGATMILPDGQILSSTELRTGVKPPNVLANPEWREDFYATLKASGLTVNRTQLSYLVKKWIIPFRYPVRDRGGNVIFVLQTSILLSEQQHLWRRLGLIGGAALGLIREDGYLISRLDDGQEKPPAYQRKALESALYRATREHADAGVYEGSFGDGQHPGVGERRYGAYQRAEHYPLYAFISFPESTFVTLWWRSVRIPLYLILGALAASVWVYWSSTRRFAGRMQAIRERLEGEDVGSDAVPSSGIREIDTLVEALAESQGRLEQSAQNRERLLLSAAKAGTYAVRAGDGTVTDANDTFVAMLGLQRDEVIGRQWSVLMQKSGGGGRRDPVSGTSGMAHRVVRLMRPDGKRAWLSLAEYQEQADGETIRYGLAIEVSERERLLSTVRAQSERFHALWQLATNRGKSDEEKVGLMLTLGMEVLNMEAAMVTEVVGERIVVRHAEGRLSPFSEGQEFKLSDTLCGQVMLTREGLFGANLANSEQLKDHPLVTMMGFCVYASAPIWVADQIYGTLVFVRREPIQGGFRDDDKAFIELLASWFGQTLLQQRQREVLQDMAMTDTLTRLPNRRAAESRFAEEIARARRDGKQFAIAICDLDRFKLINDHYGHDVGDEVLQQVAGIMQDGLREGDWVARWGGEEFIVLLHQSDSEDAFSAMERLRAAVKAQSLRTQQGMLDVTTSIGIGVFRANDEDAARILSEADGCLYEAKNNGRDCVVVSETAKRGTLWKAGMLQHALQENRVVPAFQVMVDLRTEAVVADEALARLVQSDGEIVAAGDFVEAAEGINLIHIVDGVITRKALQRHAAEVSGGTLSHARAHFINLSPQFLARPEMVQKLLEEAQRYCDSCGVKFGAIKPLVFEITERQLVGDLDDLVRDLQPLLDFGFQLALDDFGSGYSSFLYLAKLPVSFLKIEGWMISNMRQNPRVLAMVRSIIMLARNQGITTIAEGIEDAETAEMLRAMGVDWGQGYYFGRPECAPVKSVEMVYS
jgi:diguanylate cyclase (GGDEF)-like protein/PAS domain S-box-containing protein